MKQHDIEALMEQGSQKEAAAARLSMDGQAGWREHLLDAIEAYSRAGDEGNAARVRKTLEPNPKPAKKK